MLKYIKNKDFHNPFCKLNRKICHMKTSIYILIVFGLLVGCNTTKIVHTNKNLQTYNDTTEIDKTVANDTVSIVNEDLEYEIIIIEPGFNFWLSSRAKPEGYYSQGYLENKNLIYVSEWNNRVLQPFRYNPNLYEMQIDYRQGIDYGYEVNYKLYNYFIYFQLKYKQQLAGFVPRI